LHACWFTDQYKPKMLVEIQESLSLMKTFPRWAHTLLLADSWKSARRCNQSSRMHNAILIAPTSVFQNRILLARSQSHFIHIWYGFQLRMTKAQ
jgi:hypothetical protein